MDAPDRMSDAFEVFIDDDRYRVPTLYLITAENETQARALAEGIWRESRHHHGVELRRSGEPLYGAGSFALASESGAQEAES